MTNKKQLHGFIDGLAEVKQSPIDPAMLARIDAARKSLGLGISHADILQEFGLNLSTALEAC